MCGLFSYRKAYYLRDDFSGNMANLNVAILGSLDYGKELGKKGTASDLTFYNLKKGENTVTFIEPTRFPERVAPLFYAVSMSQKALLIVEQINPAFGEAVIMLDSIGPKEGIVILKNYISREQIAPLIKSTLVDGYEFLEDDKNLLRERFLEDAAKVVSPQDAASGTLPVDHFFNVRGIGTVVLGSLAEGSIKKHDVLMVLPGEKTAQVRSIQKHDEDFDSAGVGERTGIALKGIEVEDLDRGTILTNDKSIKQVSSIQGVASIVKFWPSPLKEGMVLHIGHWMQYVPARIEAASAEGDWHKMELKLKLDKMLIYKQGAKAVLTYPEGGKLRVVGTIDLP
jgi:selenocysteine-specific translation elongation factor